MNRFEALHSLGLEDGATDEEIRLAYYGIVKAAEQFDFSEEESIARRVEGLLDHVKYSKKFLLSNRSKTTARQAYSAQRSSREKIAVTPTQEKMARLHGMNRVRTLVVSYLEGERSKRRMSIWILVLCIVVSFILLRYLRGMPRIVSFVVVGAAAIAGSTLLTTSHMKIRKILPYVYDIDDRIAALRCELGLEPEDPADRNRKSSSIALLAASTAAGATQAEAGVADETEDDDFEDTEEDDLYEDDEE